MRPETTPVLNRCTHYVTTITACYHIVTDSTPRYKGAPILKAAVSFLRSALISFRFSKRRLDWALPRHAIPFPLVLRSAVPPRTHPMPSLFGERVLCMPWLSDKTIDTVGFYIPY